MKAFFQSNGLGFIVIDI